MRLTSPISSSFLMLSFLAQAGCICQPDTKVSTHSAPHDDTWEGMVTSETTFAFELGVTTIISKRYPPLVVETNVFDQETARTAFEECISIYPELYVFANKDLQVDQDETSSGVAYTCTLGSNGISLVLFVLHGSDKVTATTFEAEISTGGHLQE